MNKIKIIVTIFAIISIFCRSTLIFFNNNNTQNIEEQQVIDNNNIIEKEIKIENSTTEEIQVENNIIEEVSQTEESIIITEEPETYTTMYATVGLNIREQPSKESNIIDVVNINTELTTVDNSNENGWTKIKMNDNYYYVASKYLSNTKVEMKPKVVENTKKNTNTDTKNKNNTSTNNKNTGVLTKSKGVNYFNGHRETWYSQKVLPGKGLKIPGRHVDSRGLVCDSDGYICVASSDYPKGTIVETSLGTGKVYDSGCASRYDWYILQLVIHMAE